MLSAGTMGRALVLVAAMHTLAAGSPSALKGSSHPQTKVLVLPIMPKGKQVTRDMCDLLSASLINEASSLPGYRILSSAEMEALMSQERIVLLQGCDVTGCALEMAGAVNADDVVIGNLGTFGDTYILTLTRMHAASGAVVGRSLQKFPVGKEKEILERLPLVVSELFGTAPPVAPATPPIQAAPEPSRDPSPWDVGATNPAPPPRTARVPGHSHVAQPGTRTAETEPPDEPGESTSFPVSAVMQMAIRVLGWTGALVVVSGLAMPLWGVPIAALAAAVASRYTPRMKDGDWIPPLVLAAGSGFFVGGGILVGVLGIPPIVLALAGWAADVIF